MGTKEKKINIINKMFVKIFHSVYLHIAVIFGNISRFTPIHRFWLPLRSIYFGGGETYLYSVFCGYRHVKNEIVSPFDVRFGSRITLQ